MATFYDNFFSGNLSNWIISSAAPVDRLWSINGGLLRPLDPTSDKFGLIRYNTPLNVDGRIIVKYNLLDLYNGTDNAVVFRYSNSANFVSVFVDPGQDDERGVGIQFNTLGQGFSNNVVLSAASGEAFSQQTSPLKTAIPQTGGLSITYIGNKYDIVIYDAFDTYVASGTYTDPLSRNLTSGYVGFSHSEKWNANIAGWDSISATDFAPTQIPPTINSFTVTPNSINLGESATLSWNISSGTNATTAYIYSPINSAVPLIGSYVVTPLVNTSYDLSAWSDAGSDTETTTVNVADNFPIILSFTNSGPISASQSATLNWNISAATSAVIDNGIGWVSYTSAGSITTPSLLTDTLYRLSAYDNDGDFATASTLVTVNQLPTASLNITGSPTCSGSTYNLVWASQYGTSAVINNGIGDVTVSGGTYTVTATTPKSYTLSVYNDLGVANSYATAIVYYRAPVAVAGPDQTISTTAASAPVTLNGLASYDVEGLPFTYEWKENFTVLSTSPTFTRNFTAGVHTITLTVRNSCNVVSTDIVIVNVQRISPPIADARVNKTVLDTPGNVILDGSYSFDIGGFITSYAWYDNGISIGNTGVLTKFLDFGTHDITLVVTDNDGLQSSDSVQVVVSSDASPIANAGGDQSVCSNGTTTIILNGSNSIVPTIPTDSEIVWFEWDLSTLGIPNVASTITNVSQISATCLVSNNFGTNYITLTVSASNGFTSSDTMIVNINEIPTITTSDVSAIITDGSVTTPIILSANSVSSNLTYYWTTYINSITKNYTGQSVNINVPQGSHYAEVYAVDNITSCRSITNVANIDITNTSLKIINFDLSPFTKIVTDGTPITDLNLSWSIQNATSAGISSIGVVDPVTGSIVYQTPITDTTDISFVLTATDGVSNASKTVYGRYIFKTDLNDPTIIPEDINTISACAYRNDYIITYGLDELRYDQNRDIDIVSYLPDYIQESETSIILQTFEDYLNTMFKDQKNYVVGSENIPVLTCYEKSCSTYTTSCDTYGPTSGSCSASTSAVANLYTVNNIDTYTPAYDVSYGTIDNVCDSSPNDSTSILDKIYRLTDLLDPDLIPIDMIQNYTDNLGFVAGFNRNSSPAARNLPYNDSVSGEIKSADDDLRFRRYLRFMSRNLPEWYKIKTTHTSIAIMLYSYGLIGDFSFYYTKCYSDPQTEKDFGLCNNSNDDGVDDCFDITSSATNTIDGRTCCLWNKNKKIVENDKDTTTITDVILKGYGNKPKDWILTGINTSSLNEDLTPVSVINDQYPGYFATPHFKLLIELDKISMNFSTDTILQKSIELAVNAVRPVNTVFHGVGVIYKPDPVAMYVGAYVRMRTCMTLISDGTYMRDPNV